MSEKKPIPIVVSPKRKICPVCGKSSYSSTGIHPQCAVTQVDMLRRERLAAEKKATAENQQEDDDQLDVN